MRQLDPHSSVVMEACAGSGKTWTLVSRIIRLLLSGVGFSEILAITFTRKAAREIEERLAKWLKEMALMDDSDLARFLLERGIGKGEIEAAMPKARRLFEASMKDSSTITTFHGWFLEILRRAPLSENLAGANLAESVAALVEEAWQRFLDDQRKDPQSPVAIHLSRLFEEYGLHNTRKLLETFLEKRAEWWAHVSGSSDPSAHALELLAQELEVDPQQDVLGEAFGSEIVSYLLEYAALLGRNTDSDKNHATRLEMALSGKIDFDSIYGVFFTGEGTLRSRKPGKAQAARLGESGEQRLLDLHGRLGDELQLVADRLIHQRIYRFNESGLVAGCAFLEAYDRLKEEVGVIDFTDVEWRTWRLLAHSEHAQYMQYKLDSRVRHLLLDEFQDTNPVQWQILQSWLSASCEADVKPVVFLVGDPKQSIYRFRRAEPRLFDIAAEFLKREYGAHHLSQNVSRRSSPRVIECVNRVFSGIPGFPDHLTHRQDLDGMVVAVPLAEEAPSPAPEPAAGLRNPLLCARQEARDERLEREAEGFAAGITELVGRYPVAGADGRIRPARYGDIMVLVRKRAGLSTYERALRAAGIPYVGSARGGLLDTLEASDITALLSFLIAPFADLHLAQVLKSPIFALSDRELMELALLPGQSWWEKLQAAPSGSGMDEVRQMLSGWMRKAGILPVHDLLDAIYHEGNVVPRYRNAAPPALKASVSANLLAYLELALEVDAGRYPSLPKFMRELAELQRIGEDAPDEGLIGETGNALRFYTIHGAKGLEAPIVWLLGANPSRESRDEGYGVVIDWPPEADRPAHFSLHSTRAERGASRMGYFEAEAERASREDQNLLYVAMTRAAQALFVSGIPGGRENTWYHRIREAAEPASFVPLEAEAKQDSVEAKASGKPACFGRREEKSANMRYGTLLHEILQRGGKSALPDEDPAVIDARRILSSPHLARFFDPALHLRAWNEASYAGEEGEIGRIDRLVEFENEVWVLDYKSGEMRESHRIQLERYRVAMSCVFGKPVRAAVVFRDGTFREVS